MTEQHEDRRTSQPMMKLTSQGVWTRCYAGALAINAQYVDPKLDWAIAADDDWLPRL
jgi:hypothetical protein